MWTAKPHRLITQICLYSPAGENYTKHRLILGTHTSRTAKDYLMLVEVILPKTHAGIEGEDQDASNDRNKEGSANKGKRVDVLADYSETRGGKFDMVHRPRMRKSVSYGNLRQNWATTTLYLRHACESSSVSIIKTKSIEHVICLRTPTS